MKTKQSGGGILYLYESEQEIEKAAKKANVELKSGHGTLFFHSSTSPITLHLYSRENISDH